MFQFLLGVLLLASNFLGVSRAIAEMGAGSGPGIITMPIRGRARWAALTLVVALLRPTGVIAQNAYITNSGDGTVSVIDTASNTVIATSRVGNGPNGVAVTPDGAKVYVANRGSRTVSVIATASNGVIATIPVGNGPIGVAVTPDGARVYVANITDRTVSVINTASNTVIATIPAGNNDLFGVAVTPDGAKVYVATRFAVLVIATASNTVVATISIGIGSLPVGVAVTPDGAKVYVASSELQHGLRDRDGDRYRHHHAPRWQQPVRRSGRPGWRQGLCC